LKGEFTVAGAKNAATKLIAASLLTPESVTIHNVPKVSAVEVMLEALQFLGVKTDWAGENEIRIQANEITSKALPSSIVEKCPATFLFFGALLARLGEAALPNIYPVDRPHQLFGKLLHKKIPQENNFFHAQGELVGATVNFIKSTHSGTENAILAASLAKGKTILQNAAEEPEVNNLIDMLNSMGVKISRIAPRVIEIEGVENLSGTEIFVMPDRIEAGIIAIAAAVTHGDIMLKGAKSEDFTSFLKKLEAVGVSFSVLPEGIRVWVETGTSLKPTEIETRPHPGFMSDWVPPFTVLLTAANGESIIHETIYPNRLDFIPELKKMGAEIELFNPKIGAPEAFYNFNPEDDDPSFFHAAKIFGPTPLVGTKIDASDSPAAAALLVAALCAKGTSEISGTEHLKAGYENIVEKLKALGAKIEEE